MEAWRLATRIVAVGDGGDTKASLMGLDETHSLLMTEVDAG
jgi:hypothetical protein